MVAMTSHRCGMGTGNEAGVAVLIAKQFFWTETELASVSPQHRASSIVGKRTTRLWIAAALDYSHRIAGG